MTRKEAIEYWEQLKKRFQENLEKEENIFAQGHWKMSIEAIELAISALRAMPDDPEADPAPAEMKGPIGTGCPHCGNMEVIWYPKKDVNVCRVCGWTDEKEN